VKAALGKGDPSGTLGYHSKQRYVDGVSSDFSPVPSRYRVAVDFLSELILSNPRRTVVPRLTPFERYLHYSYRNELGFMSA
jgi:hypothetical protein